jgi:hypothetical protein
MIFKNLILTLLLSSGLAFSQTTVKCVVLDSLTKTPIEFANVGIISKAFGTVTDEKGEFNLNVPDSLKNGKMRVSILGYKTKDFRVSDLTNKNTVLLAPAAYNLNEVTVKPKKDPKYKILGNETRSKNITCGFVSNKLGCEMAVKLNIKHKETWLKKLSFNIVRNVYDSLIFRVNVYKKDKDGNPGENMLTKNLFVTPTEKTGLVEVDLSKHYLFVDDDVYVSIEWIKDLGDTKGLFFSCEMLGGTYYRSASQDKWQHMAAVGVGLFVDVEY